MCLINSHKFFHIVHCFIQFSQCVLSNTSDQLTLNDFIVCDRGFDLFLQQIPVISNDATVTIYLQDT